MVLEGLSYEQVPGTAREPLPVLYALSTCGFCMRAMDYLKKKGVAFRFLYFNKLDPADKDRVREMIRRVHQGSILFPVLFLSEHRLLVGFQEQEWEKALT
jgi:glutaredoxin-like protein NrdH